MRSIRGQAIMLFAECLVIMDTLPLNNILRLQQMQVTKNKSQFKTVRAMNAKSNQLRRFNWQSMFVLLLVWSRFPVDLAAFQTTRDASVFERNASAAIAAGKAAAAAHLPVEKIDKKSTSHNLNASPSTTKRSVSDIGFLPTLTTVATPFLTTLRYSSDKSSFQQINFHHRNYELDLERDHALPTSAPNADILKSNSNPTYPNPNRHHGHDRERHRHVLNSTPIPSLPNMLRKENSGNGGSSHLPTIPMYPSDFPSYSPPARSFFTPPLPPEYQNPFADKPTLRGTNSDAGGIVSNAGTYVNRRPIPPPSLMPGHERIPFRPPDLVTAGENNDVRDIRDNQSNKNNNLASESERKKALNTPQQQKQSNNNSDNISSLDTQQQSQHTITSLNSNVQNNYSKSSSSTQNIHNPSKEVLPSIRRILSGSNGNKGEIPEVLLKQVTSRPAVVLSYNNKVTSVPTIVLVDKSNEQRGGVTLSGGGAGEEGNVAASSNINKSKNNESNNMLTSDMQRNRDEEFHYDIKAISTATATATAAASAIGDVVKNTSLPGSKYAATTSATIAQNTQTNSNNSTSSSSSTSTSTSTSTSSTSDTVTHTHATWTIAWNIHVYLSVILFTVLSVYSFYKLLTYNKLTYLFSQSYFICIHLILISICLSRIFYLCYDAYNIHASFHIFVSELLLNLPATFLTVSFSVLVLYLFLKSLNHKNNRYSILIRPLTVVIGCGVHIVLCITLHYVESYTLQNHQQQQQHQWHYYQQQQQLQQQHSKLRQQQQQQQRLLPLTSSNAAAGNYYYIGTMGNGAPLTPQPPRVLSLICQIIYIFVCLSLGLLYLYLYRILKRILRSKSQNYIHGYQNLSYAIHITIATALLFVLLAALQIFGAICIPTTRPLIQQATAEIDWLQWGYQFSLRLIEIAIVMLISWVAGLKTSSGNSGGSGNINHIGSNGGGDTHLVSGLVNSSINTHGGGPATMIGGGSAREKYAHHTNVAGFFLPCTSSSSQEQFETDYPAVCNANTNLHTYTMRTGKLIYDDSFALNSLSGAGGGKMPRHTDYQLTSQPTYHRPYDTSSLHHNPNHNLAEYGKGTLPRPSNGPPMTMRYNQDPYAAAAVVDYMTDITTDHYENPNFDLRSNSINGDNGKFIKTSTTSTTASSCGAGGGSSQSSAASQQQMLLLQNESCYSEPLQPAGNFDFCDFERPHFSNQHQHQNPYHHAQTMHHHKTRSTEKKRREKNSSHNKLTHSTYEQPPPDGHSLNSTHSSGVGAGGDCYTNSNFNSIDRCNYNNGGVRKSGTFNNIISSDNCFSGLNNSGGGAHGRNPSSSSAASSTTAQQRVNQCKPSYYMMRQGRGIYSEDVDVDTEPIENNGESNLSQYQSSSSLERYNSQQRPTKRRQQSKPVDNILSGSNVDRSNIKNNDEDASCITNLTDPLDISSAERRLESKTQLQISSHSKSNSSNVQSNQTTAAVAASGIHNLKSNNSSVDSGDSSGNSVSAGTGTGTSSSGTRENSAANSESMLVAELGFVRFRALDDINNAQGVGIHNASIRNKKNNLGSTPAAAGKAQQQQQHLQQCPMQIS